MNKNTNYKQIETSLQKKINEVLALYGKRRKLRDGKCDKAFCEICEFDNGRQCLYDILKAAEGGNVRYKYPCGKAYAEWISRQKRNNNIKNNNK